MRLRPFLLRHLRTRLTTAALLAAGLLVGPSAARAGMILTAAGIAQGFSLSTFATGFPHGSNGAGPLGIAFVGNTVLVSDAPGNVRVFPTDTDGQNAGAAPVGQIYGGANAVGVATVGGNIYMARQSIGDLVQINADGTFNQVIVTGLPLATGIVANPLNGHLYVSTIGNNVIADVDPLAKSKVTFVNANLDGLTLSADGETLYGVRSGTNILGFDTLTKAVVFDSGSILGGPDGTVIGLGPLLGNIYTNTNSGTFVQINVLTKAQTIIGTGGSRGDFVTLDPNNGSLLLTQTDSILRLTPPAGGFGPSVVPEPATYLQAVIAACGLGLFCRFRRR